MSNNTKTHHETASIKLRCYFLLLLILPFKAVVLLLMASKYHVKTNAMTLATFFHARPILTGGFLLTNRLQSMSFQTRRSSESALLLKKSCLYPKRLRSYVVNSVEATPSFVTNKISTSKRIGSRLFGSKPGTRGNPPGKISVYNEQSHLLNIDINRIDQTISIIRDILNYKTYDVTLILTDDEDMCETNLETRGINKPTDVLSFPFQDATKEPGILLEPDFDIDEYYNLGDMMIDVPYVLRQCEEDRDYYQRKNTHNGKHGGDDEDDRGVSGAMANIYDPEERIRLLCVHGMLHLVGYDHINDDDFELMVTREEEIVAELKKRIS